MSVTILSTPGTHTPARNNQYIVASSTNAAQVNFKYKVTVQINDGTYDLDTVLRIPKRPDNSKLYFNPQNIAESYVKSSFQKDKTDFFYPTPSVPSPFKKITVGIDEEYGSPVSGFGGASASYYIWNGALDDLDFADFTYSTTTKSRDLALSPSLIDTIHYDQKNLLKTWHRGFSTRDNRYLIITAFDSSGATIQETVIENQFYSIGAFYSNNYISLNVSPWGLNNFSGVIVSKTSAFDPVIPTNTAQYNFYFYATTPIISNISSNLNTVNISTLCSRYSRYVIHFLNSEGNYDSFTFNLLSRNNTDKETSEYKQIPYTLTAANKYRYEKDTNDTVIYNTVLTNKWTLNTDWITDAQAEWLRDLFASPDVKLENESGVIISVKCKEKSYETKKQVNDKLFNITIEIENALQDSRQRA
jgi:hypothetical protein